MSKSSCRRCLVGILFACNVLVPSIGAQNRQPDARNALRIGLLTSVTSNPEAASTERGVRLGADEARQTANLFGSDVQLYEANAGNDPATSATRLLSQHQVQVLIASSAADAAALSELAERRHVLFLDVASRALPLRIACRRYSFHVEASEAMYANAGRLARQRTVSRRTTAGRENGMLDSVSLWEPTLERYGASQINERYRARYHVGMDGHAWAGWFAVKVASESALRSKSTSAPTLLTYLESAATSFDGHKGWPLSFRIADHQLRQPLYLVTRGGPAGGRKVEDVPELRDASSQGASSESARLNRALDRLIAAPTTPHCQWKH